MVDHLPERASGRYRTAVLKLVEKSCP